MSRAAAPGARRAGASGATASSSSGESAISASPSGDLLGVQARLVAVMDRGEHDAERVVSSRAIDADWRAGHLVVGVVAQQAAVGDRAVEALLGGRQAPVEAQRGLLDVGPQRRDRLAELRRVGDEVARLGVAEQDPLCQADPAQLHEQHGGQGQRHDAEHGAHQRHDPARRGQVVHAGNGNHSNGRVRRRL